MLTFLHSWKFTKETGLLPPGLQVFWDLPRLTVRYLENKKGALGPYVTSGNGFTTEEGVSPDPEVEAALPWVAGQLLVIWATTASNTNLSSTALTGAGAGAEAEAWFFCLKASCGQYPLYSATSCETLGWKSSHFTLATTACSSC
ncbi:hypothetical protein Tco_0546892 [Tanacetum coccineum]